MVTRPLSFGFLNLLSWFAAFLMWKIFFSYFFFLFSHIGDLSPTVSMFLSWYPFQERSAPNPKSSTRWTCHLILTFRATERSNLASSYWPFCYNRLSGVLFWIMRFWPKNYLLAWVTFSLEGKLSEWLGFLTSSDQTGKALRLWI